MTDRELPLVLVVEDEEDIRELVAYRLGKAGFEVITAEDGRQGLEMAIEHQPDLIVMDVMMPKMDGYTATWNLRANETTRDIPLIMLTAKNQDEDVTRGFKVGADDYLRKPFNPQELQARVKSLMRRR